MTLFVECFVFAANIKPLERALPDFGRRKGGGRRSAARQAAPLIAVISTVGETHRATLVDVSCKGARLRGPALPAPGEHFIFRVASVHTFATVAWSREEECGARFETPLSVEDVDSLRREAGSPSLAALSPEDRLALDEWITGNR